MEITLINRTSLPMEDCMPLLKKIAAAAEKKLHLPGNQMISVTFVRSASIHKINREFRGIDRPTDVISFASNDSGFENESEEEKQDLGDLFINVNYAAKQAVRYGHSEKREIGFLFLHGLLHCLGYDHMKPEDEKIMFRLQDEILDPVVSRK